jgi:outer membrane autotransporter protein
VAFDAPNLTVASTGTISGGSQGIKVLSGTVAGRILNQGLVSGSATGINLANGATLTGGITNSGSIGGGAYAIYASPSSVLSNIVLTGNAAKLSGDVYAPNTDLTIASGSFTNTNAFDVKQLIIQNGAVFNFTNIGTSSSNALSSGIAANGGVYNYGTMNMGVNTGSITGNYTQSSSGIYKISVNGASVGSYGVLRVTGSASLAGSLSVAATGSFATGTKLVILSANSIAGSFASSVINANNITGYTFTQQVVNANEVDLYISGASSVNYDTSASASGNTSLLGAATALSVIANSGNQTMQPVTSTLNAMSGNTQAQAISQTLPVLVGAASLATANSQRVIGSIVQGRQNALRGLSAGEEYIGTREVWLKGFGSFANQDTLNNVSGYKVNTGGIAIGVDKQFSPRANMGAVLSIFNSNVNSNGSSSSNSVSINGYSLGAYGDYAIAPNLNWNYQADVGLNQNKETRSIPFMGTSANGSYNSYSAHLGTGLAKLLPIDEDNQLIPSVRVDYGAVKASSYTETGAKYGLNLAVDSQVYKELLLTANLRLDHAITENAKLSINGGASYNTLNNQVTSTSTYQGGGPSYVTNGLQTSPWLYNAGVGVSGAIAKGVELNVRYDNQFTTTNYMNQMVSARLKFALE